VTTNPATRPQSVVAALLASTVILIPSVTAYAAEGRPHGPSEIIFLCQIIALLVGGRVMGELMQRVGQPAVMVDLLPDFSTAWRWKILI
jgi:hypothetical protein